ncbi:V-type proton ATPase subunit E1-like [Macadamia integrifolia]|uniref:V-type proton ATPase subunit E1-like n=1 Tax=Macadamia integrifolia TaxID=60698 RepID=UPI001C53329E|nr:V-type proton ATPase subunit E1-like [Macadamia integrifolia]
MKESASKQLLKELIVQCLLRLKEPLVLLTCREVDRKLVESVLDEAKQEYVEKAKVHLPKVTIDDHVYLPPPPVDVNSHNPFCSGAVVLASQDGKIVTVNILDARLELAFIKKLPEIRKRLIGEVGG